MVVIVKLWREIIGIILLISLLLMISKHQSVKYELEATKINHKGELLSIKLSMSEAILKAEQQRKEDLENYARQIASANAKYSNLFADNNRMRSEIIEYNNRLSTYSNEANADYAKAASTIYAECRGEYLKMGYYAEKLDAEIDSLTKAP